ncbi:MAG: hypothetical protein JW889_04870 [Verrucomicrobia bacterium]|nr:hypothetical protein [Verrucomicrobiota bacterium]
MTADSFLLNDESVARLRAVLKLPDEEWRPSLNSLIGSAPDPTVLQAMRCFLETRLPHAGNAHAARMRDMIGVLSGELTQLSSSEPVLQDLVTRIAGVQREIDQLSATLRSAKDTLAAMLGVNTKRTVGSFRVSIGQPQASVRVVDKDRVPDAFRSLQVDKRLVLRHFRSTGEVPAGVEVGQTRPIVVVKAPALG